MTLLIVGLVLFLGIHSFSMARGRRAELIGRIGEGPYKGLYSILSLAGIVLIAIGFGHYRANGYIPVWDPPVWTRHLALLLVWLAFICIAAAYLPGRIKTALKHPMLAGVKIWAVAHLLANGDLGSILLFGSILIWAVLARISAKRRDVAAQHGGTAAPAGWRNDVLAVVIGTLAYLAFAFWLHPWLIGVPVLPTRA
ncbi:NnrU family protein [Microvirga lotononidis]|uniref:Putative membrane protein n=1 Tax=Microvirga lotononidis TaxID=864069 RepID=I4Z030_9HYPH|nr:NnrU family protein [Microvirga lotononidis]EIM29572.1 putative membrane protein [Microvirga lotononidis]WQO27121.1 NnrU family protein [Microvirga lotononidis]